MVDEEPESKKDKIEAIYQEYKSTLDKMQHIIDNSLNIKPTTRQPMETPLRNLTQEQAKANKTKTTNISSGPPISKDPHSPNP